MIGIGAFSRSTGVSVDTLRAWERRYGLLEPTRTPSGRRVYSDADAAVVAAMRENMARGMPAAEAARAARAQHAPAAEHFRLDDIARDLERALESYADGTAQLVLDRLFGGFSVETAVAEVVLPVLRRLGERWSRDEITVGQEHFATSVILGRLRALARNWDDGAGPRVLLACPPGELHSGGLLCFGLLARARGWRVTYLGADTPVDSLAEAARRIEPELIVLAALRTQPLAEAAAALRRLGDGRAIWLAGAGASQAVAEAAGCHYMPDDLPAAARALSGEASAAAPSPRR